jgi:tetratricopeptide (TPR) repeat protein
MKLRKRIISLKSICIIVLICSACSPKPITRGEPDAYGCIPPPASTFASVGGDISIAQSTIGKVVTGDIKIKTQPEVINLLSKSVVDQELRSYLRCLAINQNKYTREQAAYLESMSLFSATNPTPEQFQKWQDSHPFPINTSDAELEIPDIKNLLKKNDEVLDKEFEKQLQKAPLGAVQRARDYYYLGNQALAVQSPRYKDAADYYQKSIKEYATKPAYSRLIHCLLSIQDFGGAIAAIEDVYRFVKEKDLLAHDEFFKDQEDEFLVGYLIEVVRHIEKERGEFVLFGLFERRDDPGRWQIAYSAEWFVPGKDDSYVVFKVADMLQGKPQKRTVEYKSFESLKISENFVQSLLTQLEQVGRLGRLTFWTNASGFYERVYIISAHAPKNKY